MNSTLIKQRIRNITALRILVAPIVNFRRKKTLDEYSQSEDSKYIQGLKGICSGERCFIIGNGPSLKAEDLELLKDEKCFAFNRIYYMYPKTNWRPWVYMVIDHDGVVQIDKDKNFIVDGSYVFLNDKEISNKYKSQNAHWVFAYDKFRILAYQVRNFKVKEDVSKCFSLNCFSVSIDAFELAIFMGFKEIYLLGLDTEYPVSVDKHGKKIMNGNIYAHFTENKDEDKKLINYTEALIDCYQVCKEYADRQGIKVYNCTRGGKLEVFERKNLEDVINEK
jgi:hypothetical protein